jgi:hypothetical protein
MILTLSRSGGVAGLNPRPLRIDTSSLSPTEAARLRALVQGAHFFTLPADLGAADASPDAFGYELDVTDDEGREHAVSFALDAAPPSLRALVSAVRGLPRPG